MRYKLFGNSGLKVSELCLGAMTFGKDWQWGSAPDESRAVFDTFLEAGGNFIDTANIYTNGSSERLLGEFITGSIREKIVLATKYTLTTDPKDPNASGNSRKNLHQSLHNSLKRLKTEYIDLLWIHAWDYLTPLAEVMRALDDAVRAGKVLYVGVSDTPAWVISQANTLASLRGWTPFVGMQLEYSLLERTIEREYFSLAQAFHLAITPWSPLGMGVLTGKYRINGAKGTGRFDIDPKWAGRYLEPTHDRIVDTVVEIAQKRGKTPAQVALNWVRQKPGIIIPIVGAKSVSQLKENMGCLDFQLSKEEIERLNEVSKIDKGFPHDFLSSEGVREILYGDHFPKIDSDALAFKTIEF